MKSSEHKLHDGAFTPSGRPKVSSGNGYAKCSCGEMSRTTLPTREARARWFERHTR